MDLYNKYVNELKEDFILNSINIKEVLYRLPSKKHFWSARLVNHKIEVQKLKKVKTKLLTMHKDEKKSPIKLTKDNEKNLLDSLPQVEQINDNIFEQECIIELIQHALETFKSMDWQVKNLVQLMTMEM
jgi:hypothetical protein